MVESTAQATGLERLLEDAPEVGAMVSMDYDRAVVASNDWLIREAGGLPRRCFLLAVPKALEEGEPLREVILLSVEGLKPLEMMREVQFIREDVASRQGSLDPATRAKLQVLGFSCKLLGTFYEVEGKLTFGADVEKVLGHASYNVLKPRGRSLGAIGSFTRTQDDDSRAKMPVGVVRYTETQTSPDPEAVVEVDVRDFIGKKSAFLGITRAGKSSALKTVVEQVFRYSLERGARVGQLIFDPQGEYANANAQDRGALANIGTARDVAIYKTSAVADSGTREKPLLINFFDETNAELVWELLLAELATGASAGSNYISDLRNVSLAKPGAGAEPVERKRYERRRMGFYALMALARLDGRVNNFYLTLNSDLVARLTASEGEERPHHRASPADKSQLIIETVGGAKEVFEKLLEWYEDGSLSSDSLTKSLKDGELSTFREQVEAYRSGRKGVTSAFMRMKELHSADSKGDVREEVWKDLAKGKLVIVDLSRGSTATTKAISDMIVTHLLGRASERFVNGEEMVPFQLVVEEAHNLFRRGSSADDMIDPWVRLSKEASKYQIGLMYATQEVSSVDQRILSNTSNFVIFAFNSKHEANEISNYYSFGDWSEHLRTTETKGFVRLKTESSPFIIPVQFHKFNPSWDSEGVE